MAIKFETKLSAAAFGAVLSTAGRGAAAPAAVDDRPRVVVVDRWNGTRFIEVRLVWNGAEYA